MVQPFLKQTEDGCNQWELWSKYIGKEDRWEM